MGIFGERLIAARKRQRLTQAELAEKAGITRSAVSGYETEDKDASYEVLRKLTRVLGVSADYLVGIDDLDGWTDRDHVAGKFYNLEHYYESASEQEKAIMDDLLDETDRFLSVVFKEPDTFILHTSVKFMGSARRLLAHSDDGEQQ